MRTEIEMLARERKHATTWITPREWFDFQMGRLDIVAEGTPENTLMRMHLVGRADSLAKGQYDGEYINIEWWTDRKAQDEPADEIAMDPWAFSFDGTPENRIAIGGYTWSILVVDE